MASSLIITQATAAKRQQRAQEIASKESSRFDIIKIDTSEEKGIAASKKIIAQAHKQPFESKQNSLLIIEAQNLTLEAQNALLKTLEEPSEKTQLILTAPTTDSVLPTIASRCIEIRLEGNLTNPGVDSQAQENLNLSKLLEKIEKNSLVAQLEVWERVLRKEAIIPTRDSNWLKKLHRYNRTLLKLQKAQQFSVNKKLLNLIAALEQPTA